MAYTTTTATNYLDFLDQVVKFVTGISEPTITGTGTGDIHNIRIGNTAVTELWTLTFTSATAFTVSGGTSGAQVAGTVGVAYSIALVDFIVVAGPVAFVATDTITFQVTTNAFNTTGEQWMLNGTRSQGATTGLNRYRRFVALKGVGSAGTDNIYIHMFAYENDLDPFHNIGLVGAIDFTVSQWTDGTIGNTSDLDFTRQIANQPDTSDPSYFLLLPSIFTFWLNADGRVIVCYAKVNTRYEGAIAGFFLPFGTPLQYPYPMLVGGTTQTSTMLLSSDDEDHSAFWDPGDDVLQVRTADGIWRPFEHFGVNNRERNVWPWETVKISNGPQIIDNLNVNIDGSYVLLSPVLHMDLPHEDILGEIPKIKYISGFNNSSENTVTEGSDTYVVFQNIFRVSNNNYCCLITS